MNLKAGPMKTQLHSGAEEKATEGLQPQNGFESRVDQHRPSDTGISSKWIAS